MPRPRTVLPRLGAFRLALLTGLVFTALHLLDAASLGRGRELPVVGAVERGAQDWLLTRVRGARPASGDVVIVAIDERSVREEGRWPWSRARVARLVERLGEGGVRAVGLDVLFSDDDEAGRRLARVAALLASARDGPRGEEATRRVEEALLAARDPDAGAAASIDPTVRLADAIERAGNVTVGFVLAGRDDPAARAGEDEDALRFLRAEAVHVVDGGVLVRAPAGATPPGGYARALAPAPEVVAVADSGGFLNVEPDPDGSLRRYSAVASAAGALYPSLGVALLARAQGREGAPAAVVPVGARGAPEALQEVRVGKLAIEVDEAGRAGLAYAGPYREFPAWSATDVLRGRIPPEELRGKIAIVGATAAGTGDQRVTPFDAFAPGVVAHATFVENALRGELLSRSGVVLAGELLLMIALSAALAWLFSRVSAAAALPGLLAAGAGWVALAALALREANVVLAVGMPLAQTVGMFVVATTARFLSEEREKRRARETFGRFLAPAVVDEVLAREGALRLGGEKRELTVLFADVRGFTSLAETLDPRRLIELLNEILTPLTEIVVDGHEGTLDKYMGDALMAFWGAPRAGDDHALRACRAALAMTARLDALGEGWRARGLPAIDLGIGVNTGPVSVGFVGSEDRFYNYTALGDAVNLASRLEGANKEYRTRILLGEATRRAAGEAIVAREIDLVRVKGRREPVRVYELLALSPEPAVRAIVERFEAGLAAYRGRRWEEAIERFREADGLRGGGDPPSRRWIERCEAMRRAGPGEGPGEGWDGVYEMREK
jgi:adenylate cyclase